MHVCIHVRTLHHLRHDVRRRRTAVDPHQQPSIADPLDERGNLQLTYTVSVSLPGSRTPLQITKSSESKKTPNRLFAFAKSTPSATLDEYRSSPSGLGETDPHLDEKKTGSSRSET